MLVAPLLRILRPRHSGSMPIRLLASKGVDSRSPVPADRDLLHRHLHLVLFVDQLRAQQLTHREVVERWTQLFGTPPIISRFMSGEMDEGEREVAERVIEEWRRRLCSISWFMH
jgi:hypothetical protein